MEYKYLITDIQEKTNVSITSLNAFKKKHQDFISANSIKKQRKIYYNQAAMDLFVSYYCPEAEETSAENNEVAEKQVKEQEVSPINPAAAEKQVDNQSAALEAEITALKAEIEVLRKQLDDKETERLELLRQNGALILTLQQEKQEKMLLLPQPKKKSIVDRIKSALKNPNHPE